LTILPSLAQPTPPVLLQKNPASLCYEADVAAQKYKTPKWIHLKGESIFAIGLTSVVLFVTRHFWGPAFGLLDPLCDDDTPSANAHRC
tara:strand:+ start:459 stop:722 length:264 start_codon:yes stop_codon:yes gene_type:complete